MSTESDGKDGKTTGDSGPANVSGDTTPSQTQDAAAGGGGTGTANPDEKKEDAQEEDKGDPVNVVKGTVVENTLDVALPGIIPFLWRRRYSSADCEKSTPLGRGGWTHDYHQWIEPEGPGFLLRNFDGVDLSFGPVADGGAALHRGRRMLLRRQGHRFQVLDLATRATRTYEPLASGGDAFLRTIADAYGNHLALHYEDRLLARITDTAGRSISLGRDEHRRIVSVDVAIPSPDRPGDMASTYRVATYGYTAEGELAFAADGLGRAIKYAYDGKHRIVQKCLRNGFSVRYEYDPTHGRVARTRGDGGYHSVDFLYDFDKRTTTTHSEPQPRVYHWDEKGNIVREETFDGRLAIERKWDADHLLLSEKNAAGEEHVYEYDARGFLVKETDPAGNVTVREYVDDLLKSVVWPSGGATVYEHDGYGGLWSVTLGDNDPAAGTRYSIDRDGRGRIAALHGPNGVLERRAYDERHQLVRVTGARGQTSQYEYDDLGHPTRRTDPLGRTTSLTYDAAGQITSVVRPDGAKVEFEHDGLGELSRIRTPGGEIALTHIATGALVRAVLEDGSEWRIDHDREAKPVRMRNPKGELYELIYDRAGRVTEERTFDGRTLRYHYDLAGRLQHVDQPDGSYRAFAYDALGQVVEETSPHGLITYKRDPEGRVLEARLEEGPVVSTVTFERDPRGRVIAETQDGQTLRYDYDAEGRVIARTLPNGEVTRYRYDLEGALIAAEHAGQVVSLARDAVGQERLRHLHGSPIAVASSYDGAGRLVTQEAVPAPQPAVPGGAPQDTALEGARAAAALLRRAWRYDAAGRLERVEDVRWGATDYFHDRSHNLVRAQRAAIDEAFEYDPAGAVVRAFSGIQTAGERWVARPGDVLVRTESARYEVDAGGRRTRKTDASSGKATGRVTEYVWDCRDRLREVRLPDGRTARYFYDAFGRRTRKILFPPPAPPGTDTSPPDVVRFLWDGDVLVAETGTLVGARTFVHEPGTYRPLLQAEQGEVFLYVLDPIGAPRELLDTRGRVAWAAVHRAWGGLAETQSDPAAARARPIASPFRQLGHYADDETGLHATRFRYWDPHVARWLSPEPLGLDGGTLMFGLGGSPALFVDPLGLDSQKAKSGDKVPWKWCPASEEHALDRHSPHRGTKEGIGKGTLLPKEWSEAEFIAAVEAKANDPTITRTPVDEAHGGVGETAFEPITINGVTRKIFIVMGVPDATIPGTGPGVITSAFPRHKNK